MGQIAAANALSDVYAMGGEPKLALNLLCVPEKMPSEAVRAILAGGYDKVYEAGAIITGGHSIFDEEPKYGLSVTGFVHPEKVLKNLGALPGDVLFLTKPLGTGILTTAEKAELLAPGELDPVIRLMTTLNKGARDCVVNYRIHACTDVTGFSLMGHMLEMMQGSETSARVETGAIDFLPRVLEFANMGLLRRVFTATGVLRRVPWTKAGYRSNCGTRSTTHRPPADCSSPSTRATRTRWKGI